MISSLSPPSPPSTTSTAEIGRRPLNCLNFRKRQSVHFYIHEFHTLPHARNHLVISPKVMCLGHEWRLRLYPGGKGREDGIDASEHTHATHAAEEERDDTMVAVYLELCSGKSITIDYSIDAMSQLETPLRPYNNCDVEFTYEGGGGGGGDNSKKSIDGTNFFAEREDILGCLEEGTLTIEVRMSSVDPIVSSPSAEFVPPNDFCSKMGEVYGDKNTADILIEVGNGDCEDGEDGNCDNDDSNESHITHTGGKAQFYVHRLILQKCAPTLATLCESCSLQAPLQITNHSHHSNHCGSGGITPTVFRLALRYIYGQPISNDEFRTYARPLIDVADKYAISNLKLEAEVWYLNALMGPTNPTTPTTPTYQTSLTLENVMDILLYVDAKNCALLKEAVVDYILEHREEVLNKVSLKDVPGSMFSELLNAMARRMKVDEKSSGRGGRRGEVENVEKSGGNASGGSGDLDFNSMRVSDLRRCCYEKGLPMDGSRETMIGSLKGAMSSENM